MEFGILGNYSMRKALPLCVLSLYFSACGGSLESSSDVEKGIVQPEFNIQAAWTADSGDKYTKVQNVSVNLKYYSANEVHFFNNKNCVGSANVLPYESTIPLTLSSGDGPKEFSVKFKTTGGETSECFSDIINLYQEPLVVDLLEVKGSHLGTVGAGTPSEATYFYIPTSLAEIKVSKKGHPFPLKANFSYRNDCSESFSQNADLPMYFNIPPSQSAYKVFVEYKDILGETVGCTALEQIIVDDQAPAVPKIFPLPLIEDRGSFTKDPVITVLNLNTLELQTTEQVGFKELSFQIRRSSDNVVVKPWQMIEEISGKLDFQNLRNELKATPQLYTIEFSALDRLNNRSGVLKVPWSVSETNFFIPSRRVSEPGPGEGPAIFETFIVDGITVGPLSLKVTSEARVCNKENGPCVNLTEFSQSVSVMPGNEIVFRMDRPAAGSIKTAYIDFHGRRFPWSIATDTSLCPDGFVLSPPATSSNGLYLNEFCIARREMRWNDPSSPDASTLSDNDIKSKSVSASESSSSKVPIYNISYENMTHLCAKIQRSGQALNGRLPSTIEWNHIANDLRHNIVNWKSPTDAELPVGNINTTGPLRMLDPDNPCQDSPGGSQCNNSTWGFNNRELRLSNGQSLFDFSGNLAEAVREIFDVPSPAVANTLVIGTLPSPWDKVFPHLKTHPAHACSPAGTAIGCGLGHLNVDFSSGDALTILRGGSFTSTDSKSAGVYTLESGPPSANPSPNVGFRCVTDVYR